MLSREAAAVLPGHRCPTHLRRDDVLLASPEELAQQAAGDDLALTAVVDVGGIEEDDPALDRSLDDRLGGRLIKRPLATLMLPEAHHSEADARDAQAGTAEVDVLHVASQGLGIVTVVVGCWVRSFTAASVTDDYACPTAGKLILESRGLRYARVE